MKRFIRGGVRVPEPQGKHFEPWGIRGGKDKEAILLLNY
jgi:hypothetical protein